MRIFKGFFIVLAGLFIFITLFSLFIPSKVRITRAVVITAKAGQVYTEINDLQNWKHWQPVFKADSSKINFVKLTNGKADVAEWNSNGETNTLTITERKDNAIKALLHRKGENDTFYTIGLLPVAETGQVQVEWNVLVKLKWYPWEKFYGIFIEKISGQGYEDALNNLKAYVESN